MFIAARAEAGELGDTRVEPAEGIGKFEGMEGADFVVFAESDEAGLRGGALIEREDERAIVAGSVIGAGGVAEVMIEMRKARAAAEELAELVVSGSGFLAFATRAGVCARSMMLGDGDGTAVF